MLGAAALLVAVSTNAQNARSDSAGALIGAMPVRVDSARAVVEREGQRGQLVEQPLPDCHVDPQCDPLQDAAARLAEREIDRCGTAAATGRIFDRLGARVEGFGFLVELDFLNGRDQLPPDRVFSLIHFDR